MGARASRNPRKSVHRRRLSMESLEMRRVLAAIPYGAFEGDLGEFLLGSVAVTPVLLESNGNLDASTENWTTAHINEVLGNLDEGLDWWVDTLATKSSIHELTFTIDTTYATTPVATQYEPISRVSNEYYLYVQEFLASTGIANTGNLEADIRSFNQSQRVKLGTDWSFTIFVVPSLNDADGKFKVGGSFDRAFAFAGGLFMVIPSTRPASTYTHETGHIFWARDEYLGGGSYTDRRGYYNTQNTNAADNPNSTQQPSIMASGTLLDTAYANHISPDSTLAMLGWQDSDSDGIFDVLDVPHVLRGTGYFDTTTSTYRFTGSAQVQTLPNLNTSGNRNDITVNRIREIEYRFDGGPWQLHSQPNAYSADLNLSINVPSSATEIEIRARDSKTTVTSNVFHGRLSRADATLVPGINGFVWVDANNNGLRDVGELGQAGWTVSLINSNGSLVNLQTRIEPDDFPDGILTSSSSPQVVLTSVGSDADGRVGVFNDTGTSTGTKNFRGYSRGSQSFISTWSPSSRRLRATFTNPTTQVQIDVVGATNNSFGRLEAYNAAGQLVGRATSDKLASGQVQTLSLSRGAADIAYVIVGGHANSSVKLDNLRFGAAATTTTGPQGQFDLPSLPAGNYRVTVTPTGSYRPISPAGGVAMVDVTANTATQDVDFGFQVGTSLWHNAANPYDVNDDGIVSPLDVLLIVNDINANGARDLRNSNTPSPPYIDVTGENLVSALDVLQVVNYINSHRSGSSEGEDSQAARTAAASDQSVPPVPRLSNGVFDDEEWLAEMENGIQSGLI